MAVCPPWNDAFSEKENERFPASKYDNGTHKSANTIRILSTTPKIAFSLLVGFLNSVTPQYRVIGNEIIPAHVMKVPSGIELSLSREIVNKEDPVAKRMAVKIVVIRKLKNHILLLLIFNYFTYLLLLSKL